MRKKIISVFLLICMMTGVSSAVAQQIDSNKISLIFDLGIMNGYPDGSLGLENDVTRAEFTKIAIASSAYRNSVAVKETVSPFRDVSFNHWATPYIKLALTNKLIMGYEDSSFRPENNVTFEEAITIFLKLLGYTADDFGTSWPYGQVGLANNLKITQNVDKGIGEALTRADVLTMICNLLDAKPKNSPDKFITTFDVKTIENLILIATNREDTSIPDGKILTSGGTFEIDGDFDSANIGKRGDLIINERDEILYFTPHDQGMDNYNVTSVIGSDMVLDGNMKTINENLTVYYKSQKITYKDAVFSAKPGDRLLIFKSAKGILDYAVLLGGAGSVETNVENLDQYVVYSKLDSSILTYKDGAIGQISISDSVTAYEDTQKSTFGSLKGKLEMGDKIYVKRDSRQEIEYVSIVKGNVEGPITVKNLSWHESFGIGVSQVAIMRDGQRADISWIQLNDIVYYSKDLNMVLAYSKKITGIYEKASPNKDMPTDVTVSGVNYKIESAAAFNALSSKGDFSYGDMITLLMGKNGEVADVLSADQTGQAIYGYMVSAGTKEFTNANGSTYSSYFVKVALADTHAYEYIAKSDYSSHKNSIVKLAFEGGVATVTGVNSGGVSGKVDASKYLMGKHSIARDVAILDVSTNDRFKTGAYVPVFLQRLDGVNINEKDVLYYSLNERKEISALFLNDVTADNAKYGMMIAAYNRSNGLNISGSYTYDIDGTVQTLNTSGVTYSIIGPVPAKFILNGGKIEGMSNLSEVGSKTENITGTYVETADKNRYLLSSSVVVYQITEEKDYMLVPIAEVVGKSGLSIKAYYDKAQSAGGRIRVLVVS